MKGFGKGILLFFVALFGATIVFPLGFLYSIIKSFWKVQPKTGLHKVDGVYLTLAKSVDKYGNVIAKDLLNDCLIKRSNHKFGDISETISMVLGFNLQSGTLSHIGKVIVFLLSKQHCLSAIESDK